jgi:hypothetical protein
MSRFYLGFGEKHFLSIACERERSKKHRHSKKSSGFLKIIGIPKSIAIPQGQATCIS